MTVKRFKCVKCSAPVLRAGGNCATRCDGCNKVTPARALQMAAHKAVADAIRGGRMAPPGGQACSDCAGVAIEYDHRDYNQPLQVEPVCRRCNINRGPAIGSPSKRLMRAGAEKVA